VRDAGLMGDVLILIGTFALGFLAGIAFMPLRNLVMGLWRAPGRLLKGTQDVGQRMRQAFKGAASEEALDRSSPTGRLAGAVSDLLTLRLRHAEASFREGLNAFEQAEYELARTKLSQALFWDPKVELKPLHVLAHLHLGWLDEEQEKWANARAHYERAAQLDPDNVPAALRLGMMHFRLGETGQAIFQLQRALELDPANLDTHYYLYAIYRRAKMETEAFEQLRIIKAGESAEKLVELFSRHGEDHFRMSRYLEAADDYALALQFDPSRVSLYSALGDLYYLQQQPHTALETWCRGLWAGYSEALAERVLCVAGADVELPAAIQLVRDCLARHTQDGRYHLLLSQLLRRSGEEEEGIVLLEQAARLTPGLLQAQQELGDLYSAVGHTAKAGSAYRAGLSAARAQETVYRCCVCGYVTREEQARCFQCNHWGAFEAVTQAEAYASVPVPANLIQRAGAMRERLSGAWRRVAGQLPSGE
jgi:tetratricopeptide (TPR) repeat protein